MNPSATPDAPPTPSTLAPRPSTLADTGLTEPFLADLISKHLAVSGVLDLGVLARRLGLTGSLVEELLAFLRTTGRVEVASAQSNTSFLRYGLTERGRFMAEEALNRDGYIGPAPVPLTDYERLVRAYADTFFKGSMNALRKFRDSGEQVLSGTTATYAKFYAEHWPIVGRLVHDMVKDIALESDTLADIVMKSVDLAFQEATKPPEEK